MTELKYLEFILIQIQHYSQASFDIKHNIGYYPKLVSNELEIVGKNERIVKGEPWERLFSPLIMEVFQEYCPKEDILFAITGDLDNLGVYVARNGRPAAENLVDLYNQATRNYLEKWTIENKPNIETLSFIPSGEEVFIIGIASNNNTAQNLFNQLRSGIMEFMHNQHYIDTGDTSVSFGGRVFDSKLDPNITSLVNSVRNGKSDEEVFPLYLEILSEIRKQTAIELDREKFKDILNGDYPVEVRQLVLTRMLLYKGTTRKIVQSLNQLPKEDILSLLEVLGDIYGVEPGKENDVDDFLNKIAEGKR